jgi:hypothetical protein
LYVAVNKNTDELYAEIIVTDPVQAQRSKHRSIAIIDATEAPPKIGKDESNWKCKYCDHVAVCHLGKAPERTCRSCRYVSVQDGGKWNCDLHQEFRTSEEQLAACPQYEVNSGIYAKP